MLRNKACRLHDTPATAVVHSSGSVLQHAGAQWGSWGIKLHSLAGLVLMNYVTDVYNNQLDALFILSLLN
jgi:hypothetical protein